MMSPINSDSPSALMAGGTALVRIVKAGGPGGWGAVTRAVTLSVPPPEHVELCVPALMLQSTRIVAVPAFTGVTVNVTEVTIGEEYSAIVGDTVTTDPETRIETSVVQGSSPVPFERRNVLGAPPTVKLSVVGVAKCAEATEALAHASAKHRRNRFGVARNAGGMGCKKKAMRANTALPDWDPWEG